MSIAEKAMVLNLSIGIWQGYRLDKEATRKVTEEANAASDAARVNKHLVPKNTLKEVTSAASALRNHFYEFTLPWKDNGDRLLTRVLYTKFIEEHERLVGEFNDAVNRFLDQGYPNAVEQAGFRMGEMFDLDDYPSVRELRHKFYVRLDIDAVTESGDFRVKMDQEQIDQVRASMEQALKERISGAMNDVWERIGRVVGHFAEKMSDEDKIFRNATVHNLEDLVDALPGLNVLEDPELDRVAREIKAKLCGHNPDDLRKDTALRASVAGEAKAIMDMMGGFMNAFGNQMKEAA